MVLQVHSEQELGTLISTHRGLLVIDAFAVWCGPCRTLAPKLEEMAAKYPSVQIVKVDVDELSSFADRYSISAMPTILFVKAGRVVDRVEGANPPLIENKIRQHAA